LENEIGHACVPKLHTVSVLLLRHFGVQARPSGSQ
jgi:hypothetical protein